MMKTWEEVAIDLQGKNSGQVKIKCPECSGSRKKNNQHDTPLSVDIDRKIWNCHNCGFCGSLLQNGEGSDYIQRELKYAKPEYKPDNVLHEKLYNYMVDERCIPESILKRNRIGCVGNVLKFPIIKSGKIVNIKSRGMDKKFWQEQYAEKCFFGYDDIDDEKTIIVEGEFDKMAFETAGFKNAISVPDGAPNVGTKNYSNKFNYLVEHETRLASVKLFVIAVDNDPNGKLLESELARRLGWHRCMRVVWPEGIKDANELLVKHGVNAFADLLASAVYFPVEGVVSAGDLDLETLYRDGLPSGLSTGWAQLDKHYTLSPESGDLNLLTGVPGHGKSEFLDALLINAAQEHGWTVGVFSPENFPLEYHASKLIEKYIGAPFGNNISKKFMDRMTPEQMRDGQQWLKEHFHFILPPENSITIFAIIEKAKQLVTQKGIRALVIDPWNELDHKRPSAMTETEYISQSLSMIRRFARQYSCHVYLVVHPSKPERKNDGPYKPTAYDMSGSAHWYNKADNILMVWREKDLEKNPDNEVEIHVQKVRKKNIGKPGAIKLQYQYATGKYLDY